MMKGSTANDKKADQGSRQNALCVHAVAGTVEISRLDYLGSDLLPGIPNDIACEVIAPKLSGADINTLSLVSQSWHAAVHNRWVYDARVSSDLTENFAVVLYSRGHIQKFRLYPLNGSSAYDLPPIPSRDFSNIRGYKCVALDGKIYILGGAISGSDFGLESCPGSTTLFMLDLAGHKQWKQCSSMQEGRHSFGAGVLDGKIYVVGGRSNGQSVCKCEVYDPQVDGWSSKADLLPSRIDDRVGAIGGELFVYGGLECRGNSRQSFSRYVAVYNPVQNEWRQLGHFNGDWLENPWVNSFLAQGKFHTISPVGIDVYDMDANSWSNLHPFPKKIAFNGFYTWALDFEIVIEKYRNFHTGIFGPFPGVPLVQSRGLGNKKIQIAFEAMQNISLRHDLERLSRILNYDFCLIKL